MNVRPNAVVFLLALVLLLVAVGAAPAQGLSPEERVAHLAEGQLTFLSVFFAAVGVVFTLIGIVFVGFQMWTQWRDIKRQSSYERQAEALAKVQHDNLQATALLIRALTSITETANQSQTLALGVEKQFRDAEEQKEKALQELADDMRELAESRTIQSKKEEHYKLAAAAEAVTHVQYTYGVRFEELPATALLVRAYYYSFVTGNYRRGAEVFDKVIADKKATAKQREMAFYNRGINRANMRQYAPAIQDFIEAGKLNEANLFYRFYQLDTSLLKARDEKSDPLGLKNDFEKLISDCRNTSEDTAFEPMTRQQMLTRALLSFASLLIFNLKDYSAALASLGDPVLDIQLFARYLRLVAQNGATPGSPFPPDVVLTCQNQAREEYKRTIEPRSRLLRGLIHQQCCKWSPSGPQQDLSVLRPDLLADIALLEKQGGADLTVFSPVSQQNEPISKIRAQIG